MNRRSFLETSWKSGAGLLAAGLLVPNRGLAAAKRLPFMISLSEGSLHRALSGRKMDHLDFARVAKQDYGIDAIELMNRFFADKARDRNYLVEFKRRADDLGVRLLLIMVDGEGALGDPDEVKRRQVVDNHLKWIEAAKLFRCHSIRVNAETGGTGTPDEQMERVADGLHRLSDLGAKHGLNVIVENHGGLSSNGSWLAAVMHRVDLPNCGTLPDFGDFIVKGGESYDRYRGVAEMMPFAKAVSAKSFDFDTEGNEVHTDYRRMVRVVLDAGYRGYLGIDYEGERLSEPEGIRATKRLLEKVRAECEVAAGPQPSITHAG